MRRECGEHFLRLRLERKPTVSDPGMQHGDRQPAVAGKTFPVFPAHAQISILGIWWETYETTFLDMRRNICFPCDGVSNHLRLHWLFSSDAYQRKHQSSASLAFVRGILRRPMNSPQKGQYCGKVSIWWRHHAKLDCIIVSAEEPFGLQPFYWSSTTAWINIVNLAIT